MVSRDPLTRNDVSTGTTPDVANQARHKASEVVDQVQEQAGQVADRARQQATSRLDDQKERATGSLTSVAQALRQTGQHLREQDQGLAGDYTDQAAERIEQFAGYLRRRDLNRLIGDAEDLGRRQPALFLGGAFALGLLGARFLKSSTPQTQPRQGSMTGLTAGRQADYGAGAYPASYGAPAYMPVPTPGVGGGLPLTDAVVGGPPITDVVVGGPPITDALVGGPPVEESSRGQGRDSRKPQTRGGRDAGS